MAEGHLETAGGDEGAHRERVATPGAPALRRAHRLAGWDEGRAGGEGGVELAQVVEADLRGRPAAEDRRRRLVAQVAQEAVTEAALRHRAELAADGGEDGLRARIVAG